MADKLNKIKSPKPKVKVINNILEEKHPSEFLKQDDFLQSLNLLGQEMLQNEKCKKVERRRRTIANSRYNGFLDPSAVLLSMRKSKKIEEVDTLLESQATLTNNNKRPGLPITNTNNTVTKTKSLKCDVCEKKDFNLICETCKTKYHADCIRVTGSKAPIPERLLICPKCVQTPNGVTAINTYLKNKAEGKIISSKPPKEKGLKLKSNKITLSNNIETGRRRNGPRLPKKSIFPHRKNETCNAGYGHHHKTISHLNSRSQIMEKPLSEEELKQTILSMNFAAKSVLEKGNNKIKCQVQNDDISVNVQMLQKYAELKKSSTKLSANNRLTNNNNSPNKKSKLTNSTADNIDIMKKGISINNTANNCNANNNTTTTTNNISNNKLPIVDHSLPLPLSPIPALVSISPDEIIETPPPIIPKMYQNKSRLKLAEQQQLQIRVIQPKITVLPEEPSPLPLPIQIEDEIINNTNDNEEDENITNEDASFLEVSEGELKDALTADDNANNTSEECEDVHYVNEDNSIIVMAIEEENTEQVDDPIIAMEEEEDKYEQQDENIANINNNDDEIGEEDIEMVEEVEEDDTEEVKTQLVEEGMIHAEYQEIYTNSINGVEEEATGII